MADDVFKDGQVVAVTLDPAPGALPPRGIIDRTTASRVRYVRRGPDGRHVAVLERPATAEALDLLPHPEGGWFRETWRSDAAFTPDGYPGERASATAIYFLLPPGEESMWHAVRSAEVWLWHAGGPLALLLGGEGNGRPGRRSGSRWGRTWRAGRSRRPSCPRTPGRPRARPGTRRSW